MNDILEYSQTELNRYKNSGKSDNSLVLIVPCYNEQDNIRLFVETVVTELAQFNWQILFVNDGSTDETWARIEEEHRKDERVHGLCFSRNFGHQNALKAGLEYASHIPAVAYVTLDADLQHPVSLIPTMMSAMALEGGRIVQALREDAERKISFFKKFTSRAFYSCFSMLSGISMRPGMSDFRLIDRQTLEFVLQCNERDLFLRGLLPWSGLKTVDVPYVPAERRFGESKFTLRKMLNLALSGVVGYSTKPLFLTMGVGCFSLALALTYFMYVMIVYFCGYPVSVGWASLVACVLGVGGVNMLMLGVVGVYLGKLFMEEKGRPTYVLSETTDD